MVYCLLIPPLAQLKVNLRPLWSPTAQALSTIAEHFGDSVWEMVFNELRGISESPDSEVVPHWMHDQDNEELDPISEVERTWRDPSGHKFRSQITLWLRGDAARRIIIRVSSQCRYNIDSTLR